MPAQDFEIEIKAYFEPKLGEKFSDPSSRNSEKKNERKCPLCGSTREKFIYDKYRNELVCTNCGLVLNSCVEIIPPAVSKIKEYYSFLDWLNGLGNPQDDERFLRFLRKRRRIFRKSASKQISHRG